MEKNFSQSTLFDFSNVSSEAIELFPEVWRAAEEMVSPVLTVRENAIERLVSVNAPRFSPLIAYIFATRICEPKIELRYQIVIALGNVLVPDKDGLLAPEPVRYTLKIYLSKMRRREIFGLLQVAEKYPQSETSIASLLNACSFAGNSLSNIFLDRKAPVPIRKQAIYFSGLVGFLDTIPALERLITRLESRINGQKMMTFAPRVKDEDVSLLKDAHKTRALLRT